MGTGMAGQGATPGRLGTGMVQAGVIDNGGGSTAHVKVDHRPVTQQGLAMSTRPLGPRREVVDKSYFLAELNHKTKAIRTEIEKMTAEVDQIHRDNEKYETLDHKREAIWSEVKNLEGQLADFNLAMNRVRHNMPVEELKEMYNRTKEKNDQERRQIDQIFLQAAQVESEARELDKQLAAQYDKAAQRMASLGEAAQEEYNSLKEEDKYILGLTQQKEMEKEALENNIERLVQRMSEPEFQVHRRGMELKKLAAVLEKQHQDLIEETNTSLSPAQMQDKLKEKIKRLEDDLKNTEKTTKMTEEIVESLQVVVSNKESELTEARNHKRRAEKYEALYTKDEKIQEYNDSFPKYKEEQAQQKAQLQKTIVTLLKHISKGLMAQANLPDAENFEKMKSELSFKESRVKHSKSTLQKLEAELAQRKEEVEKINGLDKKITVELQTFKKKVSDMKREMKSFKSVEQLTNEAKLAKNELSVTKQETAKRREALKNQVQLLGFILERKKRELNTNEAAKRLENLQGRLRSNTQASFQLSEWIIARKREADWDQLRKASLALTADINVAHIKCNRT